MAYELLSRINITNGTCGSRSSTGRHFFEAEVSVVNAQITLLVADRNPHVREFLKRELQANGCQVQLASTGQEMMQRIQTVLPDILILDPDMPDVTDISLIRYIHHAYPQMPVVVHSLLTEVIYQLDASCPVVFVEKRGNSIDHLKHAIKDILKTE